MSSRFAGAAGTRHQLPVFSPASWRDLWSAIPAILPGSRDPLCPLRDFLRASYEADAAVLCGSGTQALQLALQEAFRRNGERSPVALPAYSCYDLASAAIGGDAGVMLYDIDPRTLSPDLESLERVLRSGARVVVVSPLYGIPVDWAALQRIAARHQALLIEDAAQGQGASWRGRPLGSLGDISALSFGRGKGWTGGRGGALLLRVGPCGGDDLLPPASLGSELGAAVASIAQWVLGRPSLYGVPMSIPQLGLGETHFHPPAAPVRMPRFAAALLRATRVASEREAHARCSSAALLLAGLGPVPGVRPVEVHPEATPGYLRLPLRIGNGLRGLGTLQRARRLGVSRGYPTTLAALPVIQSRLVGPERHWPGAEQLVRDLLTVPTHSRVGPRERDEILRLFRGSSPTERSEAALTTACSS